MTEKNTLPNEKQIQAFTTRIKEFEDYNTIYTSHVDLVDAARRCHGNYKWNGNKLSTYVPTRPGLMKSRPYAKQFCSLVPESRNEQEIWTALLENIITVYKTHGVNLLTVFKNKWTAENHKNYTTKYHDESEVMPAYFEQLKNTVKGILDERKALDNWTKALAPHGITVSWGDVQDDIDDVDLLFKKNGYVLPVSCKSDNALTVSGIKQYRDKYKKTKPLLYTNSEMKIFTITKTLQFVYTKHTTEQFLAYFKNMAISEREYIATKKKEEQERKDYWAKKKEGN